MELDTHPPSSTANTSNSACHRVLLTPELASLVFLHVDHPAGFNATCRLFHNIASNKSSVYSWLERRFFECEQIYELLAWRGLRKSEYVDVDCYSLNRASGNMPLTLALGPRSSS